MNSFLMGVSAGRLLSLQRHLRPPSPGYRDVRRTDRQLVP